MINQELLYEVLIEPKKASIAETARQFQQEAAAMQTVTSTKQQLYPSPARASALPPLSAPRQQRPHALPPHARALHTTPPASRPCLPVKQNPAVVKPTLSDAFKAAFTTTPPAPAPAPAPLSNAPKGALAPASAATPSHPALGAVRHYASKAPGGGGVGKGVMVVVGAAAAVGFTYHTCPWFRNLFSCSHHKNK